MDGKGMSLYSPPNHAQQAKGYPLKEKNIISNKSILSLLSNIPYQGGGVIIGVFMGYIGLLLNAPYKIDSMVWMSLM
jgi:hypothetical protein